MTFSRNVINNTLPKTFKLEREIGERVTTKPSNVHPVSVLDGARVGQKGDNGRPQSEFEKVWGLGRLQCIRGTQPFVTPPVLHYYSNSSNLS